MEKTNHDQNNHSILTLNIPREYRSYVEDLSRMCMIQFVANILFNMANPKKFPLLSEDFMMTLLFIIVGVSAYWLVFRRIISFGPNESGYSESKFWYGGGN